MRVASSILVASLTAAILGLAGCPKKQNGPVHTARRHAKPWKTEYHEVFDDELDHRTLATLRSDEPFAVKARKLLEKRVELADIVLVGEVLNVADMMRSDGQRRRGVLVKVERMLRGSRATLPDGEEQISLFLSDDHPRFRARELVGRQVILFLRWVPGSGEPAFHWHCNVAGEELLAVVEDLLKRRRQGKPVVTPKPKPTRGGPAVPDPAVR